MLTPPFESPFPPVDPGHAASSACCVAAALYMVIKYTMHIAIVI